MKIHQSKKAPTVRVGLTGLSTCQNENSSIKPAPTNVRAGLTGFSTDQNENSSIKPAPTANSLLITV